MTHDHVLIGIEVEGGPADLAGHLRELTPMVDGVEIAPADPTGNGLDQHLPRGRTQVVDLVDDHLPLPQHRNSHGINLGAGARASVLSVRQDGERGTGQLVV